MSKDNEIVEDIINGLSQRLDTRVYDKYPTVKNPSQYPLIIVTRQNASDITHTSDTWMWRSPWSHATSQAKPTTRSAPK